MLGFWSGAGTAALSTALLVDYLDVAETTYSPSCPPTRFELPLRFPEAGIRLDEAEHAATAAAHEMRTRSGRRAEEEPEPCNGDCWALFRDCGSCGPQGDGVWGEYGENWEDYDGEEGEQ